MEWNVITHSSSLLGTARPRTRGLCAGTATGKGGLLVGKKGARSTG